MELLTVPEVAERLKISRSLAYDLCQRGVLPVVRFGGRAVRVSAAALDAYIAEQVKANHHELAATR